MHPILFQLGSLTFYTHGVLAVVGIIAGSILVYKLAKLLELNTDFFFDNIVYTALAGIIGARIAYFLIYSANFDSWTKIFYLWEGGLVSYGGFILGAIAFVLLLRSQKEPIMKWLDATSIGFFLGLFIGRIGDLFAGEYAGTLTNSKYLSVFSGNSQIAIPFFEAILCLIIFTIAIFSYYKFYDQLNSGILFLGTFFLYGLGRFIIDFGRDEKDLFLRLSLGQFVSLGVIIITFILLLRQYKKRSQYDTV